jgi:hypothetical protein
VGVLMELGVELVGVGLESVWRDKIKTNGEQYLSF